MATVFLVDDDADLLEQNRLVLKERGHQVHAAQSAKEALALIAGKKPDVMVLDVMMEHRSAGFTLAREIGKKWPKLPLIILSGDDRKADWLEEPEQTWDGVVRYLNKPVTPDKLADIIGEVLR